MKAFDWDELGQGVTVADGSWSTQLHKRGFDPQTMAEAATIERPELVTSLTREYAEAGARFLTTNTFAANRYTLARRQSPHSVADVNRRAAELARGAAEPFSAWVIGSVGPTGKILVVQETPEDELAAAFTEQIQALAAGGVDAILLETFSELAEILLAIKAARQACELPVFASMSFDSGPQRTRTMMGVEAATAAGALDEAGADVVGCNCGAGVSYVLPVVFAMRSATSRPLWVKPNNGLPELEDGAPVYKQTPEDFAAPIATLIEAGANIIGGCCGSGPEHIKRVAHIVAHRRGGADGGGGEAHRAAN